MLVVTLMWLRSYFEVVRNRTVHRAVLSVENPKLKELRVREEEQLNSYGWVDEERGLVRIPVEQAMDLLVQEARLRAEKILKDAQDRLAQLEMDVGSSKLERETVERRLRGILEQHLALLDMRRQARDDLDNLRMLPNRVGSEAG